MKIEFSGVSFSGLELYVSTLKLSIIRDLNLMLPKYFEKKTKKKPKKKKKPVDCINLLIGTDRSLPIVVDIKCILSKECEKSQKKV